MPGSGDRQFQHLYVDVGAGWDAGPRRVLTAVCTLARTRGLATEIQAERGVDNAVAVITGESAARLQASCCVA